MVEESIDVQERVRCARVWSPRLMAAVTSAVATLTAVVSVAAFVGICLLGIIISTPTPAAAESSASGQLTDGSPEAVVVVGSSGVIASWWGGGGARWTCRYFPIGAPFADLPSGSYAPNGVDPVEGIAYVFNCDDENGQLVSSRFVVYSPADPLGGVAVVERAVTEARRRIELAPPLPRFNPPAAQLVGLPTWLWVDNPWFEQSATASVGAVSATVHAVPVGVDWDTGDGSRVLCDRGIPYDTARSARTQSSACTHVFQRSSVDQWNGTYRLRATQRWVAWWSSSTGGGGSLGVLSRSAEADIRVIEMQALVR
jgi:hypothetical protein